MRINSDAIKAVKHWKRPKPKGRSHWFRAVCLTAPEHPFEHAQDSHLTEGGPRPHPPKQRRIVIKTSTIERMDIKKLHKKALSFELLKEKWIGQFIKKIWYDRKIFANDKIVLNVFRSRHKKSIKDFASVRLWQVLITRRVCWEKQKAAAKI